MEHRFLNRMRRGSRDKLSRCRLGYEGRGNNGDEGFKGVKDRVSKVFGVLRVLENVRNEYNVSC